MIRLRRAAEAIARNTADLIVIAGAGCIAFGLGHLPAPWGEVAAPIAIGIGLIATVRLGAR